MLDEINPEFNSFYKDKNCDIDKQGEKEKIKLQKRKQK